MLPDVYRQPPLLHELSILAVITLGVLVELRTPPVAIVLWQGAVFGTSVPEAPVDEDSDTPSSEHDVRRPGKISSVQPEPNASPVQLPP